MSIPPSEGERCKVYRKEQHIATGTVSYVERDSDYGYVVYMSDVTYADGGHGDHAEFLGGVYKFECGVQGGRRGRKSRKSSRKTRRNGRK